MTTLTDTIKQWEQSGTAGPWQVGDERRVYVPDIGKFIASAWWPGKVDEIRQQGESWLDMRERTDPERNALKEAESANTRLIAAAPDMVAALKAAQEMAGELEHIMEMHTLSYQSALDALAAFRKHMNAEK